MRQGHHACASPMGPQWLPSHALYSLHHRHSSLQAMLVGEPSSPVKIVDHLHQLELACLSVSCPATHAMPHGIWRKVQQRKGPRRPSILKTFCELGPCHHSSAAQRLPDSCWESLPQTWEGGVGYEWPSPPCDRGDAYMWSSWAGGLNPHPYGMATLAPRPPVQCSPATP